MIGPPGLARFTSQPLPAAAQGRFKSAVNQHKIKGWSTFSAPPFYLVAQSDTFPTFSFLPLQVIDSFEYQSRSRFRDRFFLSQKYVVEGLSTEAIATETFSSRKTVIKYLGKYGISLRPEDTRKNGPLPFGMRLKRYRLALKRREQAAIEKMKRLRAEGLSYEKIAAVLNTMAIPTKTRKAKWYAKTVREVLLRASRADKADHSASGITTLDR
jgi:hypothetical protein